MSVFEVTSLKDLNTLNIMILKLRRIIKIVIFSHKFNEKIDQMLPNGIKVVNFGYFFNQSLKNVLPESVTDVTLGAIYDQTMIDSLPASVRNL